MSIHIGILLYTLCMLIGINGLILVGMYNKYTQMRRIAKLVSVRTNTNYTNRNNRVRK